LGKKKKALEEKNMKAQKKAIKQEEKSKKLRPKVK
jgi:hypothetical protein